MTKKEKVYKLPLHGNISRYVLLKSFAVVVLKALFKRGAAY